MFSVCPLSVNPAPVLWRDPIIRLLGSLGAKEAAPPLQVFMTTHSPVTLRELSGNQLHVVRPGADRHEIRLAGVSDDVQSTIRRNPDAFLAPSVIVCEGATEVGLVRGLENDPASPTVTH